MRFSPRLRAKSAPRPPAKAAPARRAALGLLAALVVYGVASPAGPESGRTLSERATGFWRTEGVVVEAAGPGPVWVGAQLSVETFEGPLGWRAMCSSEPELCLNPGGASRVRLDAENWALLRRVNIGVNRSIVPEQEPAGVDVWRLAPATGDCDDYALTKREALEDRGWPGASLRFATAFTEQGEYHLVLLVETDHGTLALDNRFPEPVAWRDLDASGYRLVSVESRDRQTWLFANDIAEVMSDLEAGRLPAAKR